MSVLPARSPLPPSPSSSNYNSPHKPSLGFILSPSAPLASPSPSSSKPAASSDSIGKIASSQSSSPYSTFAHLPKEILARVAYHLVVDDSGIGRHPAPLIPFLQTCRAVKTALSFDNNPKLYHDLFLQTFDDAAIRRRCQWMEENMVDYAGHLNIFHHPKTRAIDYRTRWELRWRMREVVKNDSIEVPGLCERERMAADYWNVWFLLTEHDDLNLPFLINECLFEQWIIVVYKYDFVKETIKPGYPSVTPEKALTTWCAILSGRDTSAEETAAQVDDKLFILRPFVFACAHYDMSYAPWHQRKLPQCEHNCRKHESYHSVQRAALPYHRFGLMWRRVPPPLELGINLLFFRMLDRQPERVGLRPANSGFAEGEERGGLFSVTGIMPSILHDREWQRNSVCQDPHTSPGLPPLTFYGQVRGFWRGKFLFYDFDLYRKVLAGNLRAVYTGMFAEQVAEMEFEETVIKVRVEDVGGNGPLLCAGFKEEDDDEEQNRIREGYGHEVLVGDALKEADEEGWTKEILISGRCRTSWGMARIRGRIRSWDGLVIIAVAYSKHELGRWIWRGYLHSGGYLIGRWRDTFTSENLRGYEGAFGMVRAGDFFYPKHFPTSMDESPGVDRNVPVPGKAPSYPSTPLLNRPIHYSGGPSRGTSNGSSHSNGHDDEKGGINNPRKADTDVSSHAKSRLDRQHQGEHKVNSFDHGEGVLGKRKKQSE